MNNGYRYELKFIIDPNKIFHFLEWIKLFGAKEKYGNRTNNSIYFDNSEKSAIRDNLLGAPERKKIRIRWYENSDKIMSSLNLEIKERKGRLNNKINIPLEKFLPLINEKPIWELNKNIQEFLRDNHPEHTILQQILLPELFVKYQRSYFEIDGSIRFTFDTNIQFSSTINKLSIRELNPVNYGMSIMEIKFFPEDKNRVANLLRHTNLTPKRHSKYLVGSAILKSAMYI